MNKRSDSFPSFCAGFIIIHSIPVWVAVASKKTVTVAWREARPPSIHPEAASHQFNARRLTPRRQPVGL